jgi:energy-coupling factor transporter ATP-binding protein EcfA2
MAADDLLRELVLERLDQTALDEDAAALILAGLAQSNGDDDRAAGSPEPVRTARTGPLQSYLRSIAVEGFRGIGARRSIKLQASPGLTLIVGRNGSGKSSFAEALEFALTGDSHRWKGRPAVWREGWRNLHSPDPCSITIGLALDATGGTTKVSRIWEPEADLGDADAVVVPPNGSVQPLSSLEWDNALELYRPFLSYAELGSLLNAKPTELHDSLHSLLGLDRLVSLEADLKTERKRLQDETKRLAAELTGLTTALGQADDPRAGQALDLLGAGDLAGLEKLAAGESSDVGELRQLRQLAGLAVPPRQDVRDRLDALAAASQAVRAMAGTSADTARRRAKLLRAAIDHQDQHGPGPCPVCGQGQLDEGWRDGAAAEVEQLQSEAKAIDEAHARLGAARRSVRSLLAPPRTALVRQDGVDTAVLLAEWSAWAESGAGADSSDDEALIVHVEAGYAKVSAAADQMRAEAARVLASADETWRPLARRLSAWVGVAGSAASLDAASKAVKTALDWLRKQAQVLRDERLAPFADRSRAIWQQLRQQSNVELGDLRLDGLGSRRQLKLDVAVDSIETGGLGVMSQGELHALGLALFLPRATAAESPFRFVVIDDPVQAMDPSKVDGLARVLVEAAQTHQVVVFSHDDRLPETLRRLQLPATIWEVVRRENSDIELRRVLDPIELYLDDAQAIAKTKQFTTATRIPVVAGLCRSAIEAACHRAVWRRELDKGVPHLRIEERLAKATTLSQITALCLFDDLDRASDVAGELGAYDARAQAAFRMCDQATHGRAEIGDPMQLIGIVRRLTKRLAQV